MEGSFLNELFELEKTFHSWTTSKEVLLMCLVPAGVFIITKVKNRFR